MNKSNEFNEETYAAEVESAKFKHIPQPYFNGTIEELNKIFEYERSGVSRDYEHPDNEECLTLKSKGFFQSSYDKTFMSDGREKLRMHRHSESRAVISNIIELKDKLGKEMKNNMIEITPIIEGLDVNATYATELDGTLKIIGLGVMKDHYSISFSDWRNVFKRVSGLPPKISKNTSNMLRSSGWVIDGRFEIQGRLILDSSLYSLENQVKQEDIDVMDLINRAVSSDKTSGVSEMGFVAISFTGRRGEISSIAILSQINGLHSSSYKVGLRMLVCDKKEPIMSIVKSLNMFRDSSFNIDALRLTVRSNNVAKNLDEFVDEFVHTLK